jgi:ATP-binding cassette subfamily B protein
MFGRYACARADHSSDGPAAVLATIALHHGVTLDLARVRQQLGTGAGEVSLDGLLHAAEQLGFSGKCFACEPSQDLSGMPLPAVVTLRNEQGGESFVVLHRLTRRGAVLADPAAGVRKLSREEFGRLWTGALLVLLPEQPAAAGKGKAPAAPWRRFLGLLSGHSAVLTQTVLCELLMLVLGISTSYFVQHLVDTVLVRRESRLLNALALGMILIIVFRTLFGMVRHYLVAYLGRKVDLALVSRYLRHVLRLPLDYFASRRLGDTFSRLHDAARVREAISDTVLVALVDGTLTLLLLAVMWCYDAPLALAVTIFVPLLVAAVALHQPAVRRRTGENADAWVGLGSHVIEDVNGVETIKACGALRQRSEQAEARLVRYAQSTFSLGKLAMSTGAIGLFLTSAAGIVILWYGGHRVIDGALTIGQMLFFFTLLAYMLAPLERLASLNQKLQETLVAVDRLYQVLDLDVEVLEDRRKLRFETVQSALELRDVSFRYGTGRMVLEGLNVCIPAGKTVAFVGESGGGKSTLLKLLMGFYAPSAGRVLVDGVDLADFELASFRDRVGLVAQEPFLFAGTVRENIALGLPSATAAAVMAAARAAGLDEFIAGLPDRYETVLGERGGNLSGGQRQRVAMARALLRQPEILLFDEATSHLDTATEEAVQANLKTLLVNKTVVLVAHRLSTIRDADLIYVLHQGRIVEQGTHRQLLAQHGTYADLWRAQTGGGRPVREMSVAATASRPSNGQCRTRAKGLGLRCLALGPRTF